MLFRSFKDWALEVGGLVELPMKFNMSQLQALPSRTQITRHDCVEGWSAIAKWKGTPLHEVLALVKPLPSAKYVVFYCAVGLRSSQVATRLQPLLQAYDAKTVSNLSGGLFRWHNEGRLVVGAADDARATVHPFNAYWARFLKSRH